MLVTQGDAFVNHSQHKVTQGPPLHRKQFSINKGTLRVKNSVTVGLNSYLLTHVAKGDLRMII